MSERTMWERAMSERAMSEQAMWERAMWERAPRPFSRAQRGVESRHEPMQSRALGGLDDTGHLRRRRK